jgi:DNA-directed RNA polymerase subunit RPC12/RpoP
VICPHCSFDFETPAAHCPECGVRIVRKVTGVVKTSTVMIAAGNQSRFYRSVQEVPEPMRRRLIETTNGENSGMIVIADRAGREQWTDVVARRETVPVQASPLPESTTPAPHRFAGLSWVAWAGILLFLGACAMIAAVFQVFRR